MKSAEQIKARIAELNAKLELTRKQAALSPNGSDLRQSAETRIYRLEGNIGSLEWVLRTE